MSFAKVGKLGLDEYIESVIRKRTLFHAYFSFYQLYYQFWAFPQASNRKSKLAKLDTPGLFATKSARTATCQKKLTLQVVKQSAKLATVN